MSILFSMQRTQDNSLLRMHKGGRKMMQTSSYEAQLMVRMFVEERDRKAGLQRLLRQVQSRRRGGLLLRALQLLH